MQVKTIISFYNIKKLNKINHIHLYPDVLDVSMSIQFLLSYYGYLKRLLSSIILKN